VELFPKTLLLKTPCLVPELSSPPGHPHQPRNDLMMIGLVLQVVTLGLFGALAADVYFRVCKYRGDLNDSTKELCSPGQFRYFLIAKIIACACISIRCVYRNAEMAGSWRNRTMENEPAFVVLDV
jgi:hypothetical protein